MPSFVDFSRRPDSRNKVETPCPSGRRSSARTASARNDRANSGMIFPPEVSDWGLISTLREEIALKDAVIQKLRDENERMRSLAKDGWSWRAKPAMEGLYSRKCSSGGISSDSNEGAENVSQLRLRSPSRLATLRNQLKDARSRNQTDGRRTPPSEPIRCVRKYADEIDAVVQVSLGEQESAGRLKRVSYGVYSLGAKQIGVSVKNGKPLVRIGGGASVNLETYLDTH